MTSPWKGINNKEQEVTDELRVCVLNILPEVSTLSSLVAVSLVEVEIYFFQLSYDLTLITWSGSCDVKDGSLIAIRLITQITLFDIAPLRMS